MDQVLEEHVSPDGFLRLVIIQHDDGDISIGFEGSRWHTHVDILSKQLELPEDEAVRQFVDAILSDQSIVCVSRIDGEIDVIFPTDDPISYYKYIQANETLEFRYWSGMPFDADEEILGR